MSDTNFLAGGATFTRAPVQPQTPVGGVGGSAIATRKPNHQQIRNHILSLTRGKSQDDMISVRDNAGKELAYLAKLMRDPKANAAEVERYLHNLTDIGQIKPEEAFNLLRTVPQTGEPHDIRQWARAIFAVVLNAGVNSHAAFPEQIFPRAQNTQQAPGSGGARQPAGQDEAPQAEQAA